MFRKILQPFYTAYVIVTFVVCLLLAFPYFLLMSIGGTVGGRRSIWGFIRYWSIGWLWLIGMPVRVSGTVPSRRERHIIVANHISYLDTLVIFPAIRGYFRPLGKKEISKIPVLGFVYKQIVVMVDRSSERSRTRSMKLMWRILKHDASIVIFPEGTFNETDAPLKEFYNGAFKLAINTQTPVLPMILPDTMYRWHYSDWWKLWPGKNRAIFLPPVPTKGMTMDDLPMLKQQVYNVMEAALLQHAN